MSISGFRNLVLAAITLMLSATACFQGTARRVPGTDLVLPNGRSGVSDRLGGGCTPLTRDSSQVSTMRNCSTRTREGDTTRSDPKPPAKTP